MLPRTELGSVVSTRLLRTSKLFSGNKENRGFRLKLLDCRRRKESWEQMDCTAGREYKTLSALHPSSHISDDTFFCSSSSQMRSIQTYQRRDLQRRLPAGWITSMDTREEVEVRLLSSSLDFCFSSLTFLNLPLLCVCVSVFLCRCRGR